MQASICGWLNKCDCQQKYKFDPSLELVSRSMRFDRVGSDLTKSPRKYIESKTIAASVTRERFTTKQPWNNDRKGREHSLSVELYTLYQNIRCWSNEFCFKNKFTDINHNTLSHIHLRFSFIYLVSELSMKKKLEVLSGPTY